MPDVFPVVEKSAAPSKRPSVKRQREADSESDDEPRQFRRVRIRCRQRAKKEGSQDGAEFETLPKPRRRTMRCICGERDDLGLPENNSDYAPSARTARTWLIQCVDCKVWQHRSCVGTANGNDPLGGWYCERCPKVKLIKGRCRSCNRAESPEWRRGPDGPKTLCNACGLRRCLSRLSDC